MSALNPDKTDDEDEQEVDGEDIELNTLGGCVGPATLVLLGRAHESMGNVREAIDSYREALMEDVYCTEALDCLYNMHALTANEEQFLMSSLPFKKQCSVEEERMLKYLYQSKLRHYKDPNYRAPESCTALSSSIDVVSNTAEMLFHRMNVRECLNQTKAITRYDPYHLPTLLTHIPCCILTESSKDLYILGHNLVKHFPSSALSWYAVSAYYYAIGKHTQARRYLTKSINQDAHFAHSHLLFGLSFTSEGEHDQAIAAFSHAARYLRGSHVPLMYLGKEYFATNSLPVSTSFFKNALALAPNDPALLQEVGLVLLSNGNYVKAEKYFQCSIAMLSNIDAHATLPIWEPVFNNLGHTLRKLGRYQESIESHNKALQLCPNKASTLSAIAFVHLLLEDFHKVIEYCNRSLRVKREDLVTIELLQTAMKELGSITCELDCDGSIDQMVYNVEDASADVSGESAMQTD